MSNPDDILYNSNAYRNIKKYKIFLTAVRIYYGNYSELIKSFKIHGKVDLAELLDSKDGNKRLYSKHLKISRYLHNYVASITTLIQATSVYYKENFEPENLISDYNSKINTEVNNQPVKYFIKDLRNYIQHKEIPDIMTTTAYESSPSLKFNTYVKYQVKDLLNYKKWSKLSKKYIQEHARSLNIIEAVEEFHNIFFSFTSWFINQVEICLENDRKEVEKLKIKMNTEKFRTLTKIYFEFGDQNISGFERTFLPRFRKGERLYILREKKARDRAARIIKMFKKYLEIGSDFEKKVLNLYS